ASWRPPPARSRSSAGAWPGRCRVRSPLCSRRTRCSPGTRCSRTSISAWCSRACRAPSARHARNARSRRSGSRTSPSTIPARSPAASAARAAPAGRSALEPGSLLLAEPFGALDEQTRMILGEDLSVLLSRTEKTIVFVTHSLGEAPFLADRVAVFSARPGTIKKIIAVDEPHPRRPDFVTSAKFTGIRNELYALLHDEIRKTMVETSASASGGHVP